MPLRSVRSLIFGTAAAVVVLLVASAAHAQGQVTQTTTVSNSDSSSGEEGVGISLKGGPLFSALSSDAFTSPLDTRTGWIGGVEIGGNRPGVVGVLVDLFYARQKVSTGAGDVNLDSVDVPVLARINLGSPHRSGVAGFVVVGPEFDWRLNQTLSFSSSVSSQTAGFDVGIAAGAGVEITRFILEGRYERGFRNIAKDLSNTSSITSHSFAILVGVRLN